MFTPRSDTVLMRWRNCCGRASGARCVAPFWWPFEWQSKQAAPRLGICERRSSVALNCCWGQGVSNRRSPSSCLGVRRPLKKLVIIGERDQLVLRDIAQIGARGQVDGRRKRGQELIRQIEIYVEPGQVSPVLVLDRLDQEVQKDEAALGMVGMRQGVEPLRIEIVLANLVQAHRRQPLPGHPSGQLDAETGR